MMARTLAIARKEVRQLRRDRLTFGMIGGIPLMLMLLFGYAINYDVRHLPAAVFDEAQTSLSRALIGDLRASGVLELEGYCRSGAELEARMRDGEISIGVHIPHDLERRMASGRPWAQLIVNGSEPSTESIARSLLNMPPPGRPGIHTNAARSFEVRIAYNPERRTAVQVVPALIGVILNMTMVLFTAVAIVRERERGNLELLITTPASAFDLMAGKLLPYVFIGLLQVTIVLLAASWLFDVPIQGGLLDLYLGALLFIAAALTLGLMISTVAQNQMQAFQMAFFIMLPSILLSGFAFPFQGMPRPAQWIAQLLPLTHFIDIIRGIVLRNATLLDLGVPIAKLSGLLCVFLIVAMLRFRKRLD
jgi:ABC-2 type transport system permease protein